MILNCQHKNWFRTLWKTALKNLRIACQNVLWFHLYCYRMLKYLFDECTVYSKLSFIEKCSFIGNKLKLLFFLCYVIRILYLLQKNQCSDSTYWKTLPTKDKQDHANLKILLLPVLIVLDHAGVFKRRCSDWQLSSCSRKRWIFMSNL